jgi:hypothetical protein
LISLTFWLKALREETGRLMFLELLFPNRNRIKRIMDSLDSIKASLASLKQTADTSNAKVDLLITAFGVVSAQLSGLSGNGGATSAQLDDLRASLDATVSSLAGEADKVTAALAASGNTATTRMDGGAGDSEDSASDAGDAGGTADSAGTEAGTGTIDPTSGVDGAPESSPAA